jgi:hypothetical protein
MSVVDDADLAYWDLAPYPLASSLGPGGFDPFRAARGEPDGPP